LILDSGQLVASRRIPVVYRFSLAVAIAWPRPPILFAVALGRPRRISGFLIRLDRTADLHQWLGELPSNTARAYLCIRAAETLQRSPSR
jgi:hypothetical protein